jgi:hemolysin D
LITAPVDGVVQQLGVHTVGDIVTPAQPLLVVVPAESGFEIEAMVSNRDIGFVQVGQEAEIKVQTFNFTRYGLLCGQVLTVSQDAVGRDPHNRPTSRRARMPGPAARRRVRTRSMLRASRSTAQRCKSRINW